jgi:hypothetical protein
MAHTSWLYNGDSLEIEGDDECTQAIKRQPYFMLECSKIDGSSYVSEICTKDISDITENGFIYLQEKSNFFFVLDKNCAYLLGVFDLKKKRIYQIQFDEIKEKSKIWKNTYTQYTKIDACVLYQKIVQAFLSEDSDEYQKSFELLSNFKRIQENLKRLTDELEIEIERMILEYIFEELKHISSEPNGINVQGTIKHYLKFFINK